ncbi:MAG: hypothetical protein MRECE_25c005 [Mycoplasmataceae bacterium CE_OT135]|nr:MAG: hypothetical protein MRECE_25c005 [Mycoplasmataceae bacterium CE_OT135]
MLENEKQSVKELAKAKDINNFLAIKHLEKFAQKYNDAFACELQFKASRNSSNNRRMVTR